MKAMVLKKVRPVGENPLELTELPVPQPGLGEIRVQVRRCGICHTDLHTVEGDLSLPVLPLIPGHQVVGVVDAVGDGEQSLKPGERVGLAWLNGTCGSCSFCRDGRENLCEKARFTGFDAPGGYAEFVVVNADYAYRLPPAFSDDHAAPLLCGGIIGYRALRLSRITPGGRLGLYGFGASAHITIQIARHLECNVYVFSRGQEHRRLAEELGARWTGEGGDKPPAPLDSAIIFAPAGGLVPDALANLARGGTLALAGITMTAIPELDYRQHLYFEKNLCSVTNATRQDGREFLKLAAEIPIRTQIELYPLETANAVLQKLKRGEINGAAVLTVGND